MIHTDYYRTREDGVRLVKTYSDDETKAVQSVDTGYIYLVAIDPEELHRQYIEVDCPEDLKPNSSEDENTAE